MINKRKHQRHLTQQVAKSDFLTAEADSIQRYKYRPVISNISFGGMGLIFVPALDHAQFRMIQSGKVNLFAEFNLPPSAKMLGITGRIKWGIQKILPDTSYTTAGIEFVHKTPELFADIDRFIKSPAPFSDLFRNKRFFPRISSDIPAQISIPGLRKFCFFPVYYSSMMKNISATGALLVIKSVLKEGEMQILKKHSALVSLKFQHPKSGKFYSVNARPVYVKKSLEDNVPCSVIGVKFVNLTDKDKSGLIEYTAVKKVSFLKNEIGEIRTA